MLAPVEPKFHGRGGRAADAEDWLLRSCVCVPLVCGAAVANGARCEDLAGGGAARVAWALAEEPRGGSTRLAGFAASAGVPGSGGGYAWASLKPGNLASGHSAGTWFVGWWAGGETAASLDASDAELLDAVCGLLQQALAVRAVVLTVATTAGWDSELDSRVVAVAAGWSLVVCAGPKGLIHLCSRAVLTRFSAFARPSACRVRMSIQWCYQ